ncbi:GPW/gp25 family protein [Streptomyces decoyicus]
MTGPLSFPLRIDGTGRTASADPDRHIRDLIELVLLTEPGERVMRPDFGCGLRALVFAPLEDVMLTATRALVESQLRTWLDDVVVIDTVDTQPHGEAALMVTVGYRRLDGRPGTTQVVTPS